MWCNVTISQCVFLTYKINFTIGADSQWRLGSILFVTHSRTFPIYQYITYFRFRNQSRHSKKPIKNKFLKNGCLYFNKNSINRGDASIIAFSKECHGDARIVLASSFVYYCSKRFKHKIMQKGREREERIKIHMRSFHLIAVDFFPNT